MGRHIFLSVLTFTLIAVFVGVFVLPGQAPRSVQLPWQITVSPAGNLQVFGVEFDKTTLGEAEQRFGEPAEVSLFVADNGERSVEAYFDRIDLSGFRAKMVVVMSLTPAELDGMYERGVRTANMGGGRKKVTLSDADLMELKLRSFDAMTYLPKANLDGELIRARFGEPSERIIEEQGKTEHWLYPQKGLDIVLNAEEKEVFQYVQPRNFDKLRAPLVK